jgi:hypothetical protein
MFVGTMAFLLCGLVGSPNTAAAQAPAVQAGWNIVCNDVTTCTATTLFASSSFIDANVFPGDLCAKIFLALNSAPVGHPVIDARGIRPANQVCTGTETPWVGSTGTYTNPSTILLPAGRIIISQGWILPNNTKLIGVGTGNPTQNASDPETTIQASGSSFNLSSLALLQMCSGTVDRCNGVGISNLILEGSALPIDGIRNFNAEELSYVEHVSMHIIGGTGLNLGTNMQSNGVNVATTSNHSGPYSDLWISAVGASTSPACVKIINAEPRGIHGITCSASSSSSVQPFAAIYLDGQNVSIEDVHVEGFKDAVVVGDQLPPQPFSGAFKVTSNVVFNVTGVSSSPGANGPVTNAVHICNPATPSANQLVPCHSFSNGTVGDLSLQAIAVGGNPLPKSIEDDLTGTTLTDTTVGLYAIGQTVGVHGVSRFSTSPNTPTWGVGQLAPTSLGIPACSLGTLYSNTSGNPSTLYVCAINNGQAAWVPIR